LLSELVSLIGDRLVVVALVALVYEQTRSASAVGILMLLKAVPAVALGSLAGALVDRWNRKWVMVGSNLAQGMLVLLIPLTDSLAVLFVAYLAMSIVNQLFIPARAATIPDLVPPAALMSANSLFGAAFVGAIAIGPAVGGWVGERFGLDAAFYLDSLTFLVPAVAVALLRLPSRRSAPSGRQSLSGEARAGWSYIRGHRHLLVALASTIGAFLIIAVMGVLGVVVAKDTLGLGTSGFGGMMSAMGVGMLAAVILVGRSRGGSDRGRLGLIGLLLAGGSLTILPLVTIVPPAMLLSAVMGVGILTVQVSTQTTLQHVPADLRGRVMGVNQTATGLAQLLATALTSLLAGAVGPSAVLIGTGLLVTLGAATLVTLVRPRAEGRFS
jgi:predicted MFS family arabinose efflux permease